MQSHGEATSEWKLFVTCWQMLQVPSCNNEMYLLFMQEMLTGGAPRAHVRDPCSLTLLK